MLQPMTAKVVYKADIIDPPKRIVELISLWEPRIARAFFQSVADVRAQIGIDEIIALIEQGTPTQVLPQIRSIAERVASVSGAAYGAAAVSTAQFLSSKLSVIIDFDQTNTAAVEQLRNNRLNLVREFSQEQINATRTALIIGTEQGFNPRQQARSFRNSIGLTQKQVQAVNNYRNALLALSSDSLQRQLRDKRFDPTVRRAVENQEALTQAQVNRMVERYQQRYLRYRSEVIARSEALESVNSGNHNMYQQAIEKGDIQNDDLERTWNTSRKHNVRSSHQPMNGQKVQGLNASFISGAGNRLRYPGDRNAPASETVQCQCVASTRIKRRG